MNDKALLLCAASILGLLVWRHWLATQGAMRRWASIVVWCVAVAAAGLAVTSRYLLGQAFDVIAGARSADKASALAEQVNRAMIASAAAMVCLAAGTVLLGVLTFAHRRREATGSTAR